MLFLENKELKLFETLIGQSLSYISSDDLRVYNNEISFLRLSIELHFNNKILNNLLLICDYKKGFYETYDEGIIYYKLLKNNVNDLYKSKQYHLNYSQIKKIEIYGREIPKNHSDEMIQFNKKLFKGVVNTDVAFFFYCEKGERFMIAFDDFSYGFAFFHGNDLTINDFFDRKEEETIYKLKHTIE